MVDAGQTGGGRDALALSVAGNVDEAEGALGEIDHQQ